MDNPWDIMSGYFDTYKTQADIPGYVADNILLAWPPILHLIQKKIPQRQGKRALDFGCGTGGFCHALRSLEFSVTGIDSAPKMIEIARKRSISGITYLVGDTSALQKLPPFAAITSIMVLQFIPTIEKAMRHLVASLEPGGILTFAVFNPAWVSLCLQTNKKFYDFDSIDSPTAGMVKIGGKVDAPICVRTAADYDSILSKLGVKKVLEVYPPFTKAFLSKYPMNLPTSVSEYLILGYQKKA